MYVAIMSVALFLSFFVLVRLQIYLCHIADHGRSKSNGSYYHPRSLSKEVPVVKTHLQYLLMRILLMVSAEPKDGSDAADADVDIFFES